MNTKLNSSTARPWIIIFSLFIIISIFALSAYSLIKPVSHNAVAPATAEQQLKKPAQTSSPVPTASPNSLNEEEFLGVVDSLQFGDYAISNIEE